MRAPLLGLAVALVIACDALDPHGDLPSGREEVRRAVERVRLDGEIWLNALEEFRQDFGRYPSGREGLEILVIVPYDNSGDAPLWQGPYGDADASMLMDPWRRPYVFESTGERISIVSPGPDRRMHTGDEIRVSRFVDFYQ